VTRLVAYLGLTALILLTAAWLLITR